MLEEWRLKEALKRVHIAREKDYKAKKDQLKTRDAHAQWMSEWDVEIDPVQESYDEFLTRKWRKKAWDKFVELPPRTEDNEYWERTSYSGSLVLTRKGINYLRSAVRQESLAEMEILIKRAAIVFGIFGAVAALGGLANIISLVRCLPK